MRSLAGLENLALQHAAGGHRILAAALALQARAHAAHVRRWASPMAVCGQRRRQRTATMPADYF